MFSQNLFSICMAKRLHIHLTNVKKNSIQIELFKPNMSNYGLRTPCIVCTMHTYTHTHAQKPVSIFFVSVKWFNWQWLSSCEFNDHNCQFKEPYKVFILSVWSAHCLSAHHHWIYHKQSVRSSFVIVYSQWIYVFILSRDPTQILLPRKRLNRNNHTYDIEYVSNVCSNLIEAWNQRTQKYTLGTEQITKHPKIHIDTKNKQNKCQRKLTGGAMEK